jgi:hypothetical protein
VAKRTTIQNFLKFEVPVSHLKKFFVQQNLVYFNADPEMEFLNGIFSRGFCA